MPPRKQPVLQNSTARIILTELDLYAKDRQFYPLEGSLFTFLTKGEVNPKTRKWEPGRYPNLTWGMFHYWFERLVSEHYIDVDFTTRAVRCLHLAIVERGESPLD